MAQQTLQGQYAGFVSRAIAFVVDLVIISIVIFLVTAVIELILDFFGLGGLTVEVGQVQDLTDLVVDLAITLAAVGVNFCFMVGYTLFFWVLVGQTPGKALLGIRLVRFDGQRMTLKRSLVRFLAYWVSALPLGLGFLWVLIDNKRQGWHDKIVNTCVIYAWPARLNDQIMPHVPQRLRGPE